MDRRHFLAQFGWAGAAMLRGGSAFGRGDTEQIVPATFSPIKVKGRVLMGGRGMGGVAVSDGRMVVPTNRDGRFELITDRGREFVFVSIPGNAAMPVDRYGCSQTYVPIDRGKPVQQMRFDFRGESESLERHTFLAIGDPQTENERDMARFVGETIPDVQHTASAQSKPPSFAAACGDIMYDNLALIPEYQAAVAQTCLPFINVAGNHDVDREMATDADALRTFQHHFGPANFSFNRGEVHYIVLDDVFWYGGYFGYLSHEQLTWLAGDLALVEPGATVVVFVHIPPYCEIHRRRGFDHPEPGVMVVNRELAYRVLEKHRVTFICGHTHESEYLVDQGVAIDIGAAACGAWWTGPICSDGTPNGYSVYQVHGSELRRSYKATGLPAQHQMRLYRPTEQDEIPGAVLANVWAADDNWTIEWFENGENRGRMLRIVARDPLARECFDGKTLPEGRTWVEPFPTGHLYFAQPAPHAREIVVEARDPWGRTYSKRLIL